MTRPTRRDFLKIGATAVGSAALGRLLSACGATTPANAAPTSAPATSAAVARIATIPAATPATAANFPHMAVARNGQPEELVRRALAAFGGMSTFVPKGSNVVIKPNICVAYWGYQFAATTNPWVVSTLVKTCFQAGATSVKVMDYPFGGTQEVAYSTSGIQEQVEAAGGQMMPMPGFKFLKTAIPGGVQLKVVNAFEDALKADVLINVPIAKVHNLSRLTLGMKNLMGLVRDRQVLHAQIEGFFAGPGERSIRRDRPIKDEHSVDPDLNRDRQSRVNIEVERSGRVQSSRQRGLDGRDWRWVAAGGLKWRRRRGNYRYAG